MRGNYLRATAEYRDMESTETAKSAVSVSAHAVLAERSQNQAPTFPDQNPDEGAYPTSTKSGTVAENTPAGQPVGAPVAATDKDAADKLTYTLLAGGDATFFSIDKATGQLNTKGKLDFEDIGNTDNEYVVMVRATDPFGIPTAEVGVDTNSVTIMVTIKVTNVDEAPTVATGATTINHAENVTALDVDAGGQAAVYMGTDPEDEGQDLKWSVSGADSSKFAITPPTGVSATLNFKVAPDFEANGDANGDNVYEVTVVLTDSKAKHRHAGCDRQSHQHKGRRDCNPVGAPAAGWGPDNCHTYRS